MKKLLMAFGVALLITAFSQIPNTKYEIRVAAQLIPKLEFYHGRECPHCHKQHDWLPTLKKAYPDVVVETYEVWHDDDNQKRMQARLAELGTESEAVPTNIIEQDVIIGFKPDVILETMEKYYGAPAEDVSSDAENDKPSFWAKITNWFKSLFGGGE